MIKAGFEQPRGAACSRAGARTLRLLALPLVSSILNTLSERPLRLAELSECLGGPPQTTLRARLSSLAEIGAVGREGCGMPYAVHHRLRAAGQDLVAVSAVVAGWLACSPGQPRPLHSPAAIGSLRALAAAWESNMLRALAARPLTLTQLDALIRSLTYPALERRLAALRASGMIERQRRFRGPGTPYVITAWGRASAAPIAAAARFECNHLRPVVALRGSDVEAAFLLGTPIARLEAGLDGTCLLAAHLNGREDALHGVRVAVDRGTVVECVSQLEPRPRSAAIGSTQAWLEALVRREAGELRIDGDSGLACGLIFGLHDALFASVPGR